MKRRKAKVSIKNMILKTITAIAVTIIALIGMALDSIPYGVWWPYIIIAGCLAWVFIFCVANNWFIQADDDIDELLEKEGEGR